MSDVTVEHKTDAKEMKAWCDAVELPVPEDEIADLAALYDYYRQGRRELDQFLSEQTSIAPPRSGSPPTLDHSQPDRSTEPMPWAGRSPQAAMESARALQGKMSASPTNAFINPVPLPDEPSDGPLAGAHFVVKDNIPVLGAPLTFASALTRDSMAVKTAKIVTELREAGAICVAKTNLGEFAMNMNESYFGPTRNPWNLDYSPGGSSSGSAAAVAAGYVDFGIGTDAGGSVRIPASFCGIVGFRPTSGSLDIDIEGGSPSLDNYGLFARKTATVAEIMKALTWRVAPADPKPTLRIGVVDEASLAPLERDVASVYRESIEWISKFPGVVCAHCALPELVTAPHICKILDYAEVGSYHRALIRSRGAEYTDTVRPIIRMCQLFSAIDYVVAKTAADALGASYEASVADFDAVITPTVPMAAPRLDGARDPGEDAASELSAVVSFTSLFNVIGHPTISLPAGLTEARLPVGIQIIGRRFHDLDLLRIAGLVEQALAFASSPEGLLADTAS